MPDLRVRLAGGLTSGLATGVATLRGAGSERLRSAVIGDEGLSPDELATEVDPGLFGPESVAWRIHADGAMFIGGLRSLMLQTLHPLAMAGVAEHSDYRHDPWGRLNRTGRFIGATTFGSTPTAETSIAMVHRVHQRVVGTAPDGRPYAANDPHLLLWVHVAEIASFLDAHERYGDGKLRDAEKDRYVAEMAEVARRLGSERPPESVRELDDTLRAFRDECKAGDQARDAMKFLLVPPVPTALRPSYALVSAAAVSSLPRWARRELRTPVPPLVEPFGVRPAALALTRTLGWLMQPEHDQEPR